MKMARKTTPTSEKDIILNIITRLKTEDLRKQKPAIRDIVKHFGNLTLFKKTAATYGIEEVNTLKFQRNYYSAIAKIREQTAKAVEKERKNLRRIHSELGANLSLLFTSWRISYAINGVLKDWFSNYNQIVQNQSKFTNQTNKLSAAFSYLKFVIVDAFSRNRGLQKFVDLFITLVNKVAEFISANPEIAIGLVVGGFVIKTLSDLAGWVAQFILLANAIRNLAGVGSSNIIISLITRFAEGAKTVFDIILGKIPLSTLTLPVKITVIFAAAALTLEVMKLVGPYLAELGKKLGELFSDIFRNTIVERITNTFVYLFGQIYRFLYNLPIISGYLEKLTGVTKERFLEGLETAKQLSFFAEKEKIKIQNLVPPLQELNLYAQSVDTKTSNLYNLMAQRPQSTLIDYWFNLNNQITSANSVLDDFLRKLNDVENKTVEINVSFPSSSEITNYTALW